jgi:succinate dehydrogenase / fumarate reductase, cytochrome b subunit
MANKRPVNLNLISFKFPLPSLVSIAHRISGVLMFVLLPFVLFLLTHLLAAGSTGPVIAYFHHLAMVWKVLAWVMLVATIYHCIAGIRHLFMDMGIGESFVAANRSAIMVFITLLIVIVLTGVWLWA